MERTTRATGKRNFLIDGLLRSLSNLEARYKVFGREVELCPPSGECLSGESWVGTHVWARDTGRLQSSSSFR